MSNRVRRTIGWSLLVGSTVGFAATFPMWLAGLVSDRALLGVTLALSWLALMFEAANMTDRIEAEDDDEAPG